MAISYTTYYSLPVLDDGGGNWGAVWNGILEDLDQEVHNAQNLLTYEGDVLTYEGDVLYYSTS